MALQASPPAVTSSLSDSYSAPAPARQNPATPQRSEYYSQSQPSSAATARPLPTTQRSPQTAGHVTSSQDGPSSGPQPPPRSSSNQQRSTSLALATDTQIRSRGNSQGGYPIRTAQGSSSHPQSGVVAGHAQYQQSPSQRPAEMSRGNSEVISKVVIDDPKVDVEREKARLAEAVPESTPNRVASMPPAPSSANPDSSKPMKRQDFSASSKKRGTGEVRIGEYILGQTLGEGEFGKVKLGWKRDGTVQVAVKLIRRENLNTNPSRLPKIYREITILGQLSHPNIVKLHEMVETERYIGIILEYASGGELFDYILTHRYLKDNAARRLFAQLVSGVGYLHKKGIVHRDLKLENLLLDRNRNLMITDFGFANTFDPRDELGHEIEENITDKDFVRRNDLERVNHGFRRGDLMQTSCGSPCYAAPELVVSDSLYTGRKVDVWSCGVILYAMLAGYLPFDDDPANPEGDNINLLYKYICSTPLTFPEYVTPHARDLLRRILVPDPRKRADLFEVARHSWLNDYAHVVEHITKMTTTIEDIAPAAPINLDQQAPPLARSASVREPGKTPQSSRSPAATSQSRFDEDKASSPRDKRRTVQVEYVAPRTQTTRGEASPPAPESIGIPSTIPGPQIGKVPSAALDRKPLPQDPPVGQAVSSGRDVSKVSSMAPPTRPGRDAHRSVSENHAAYGQSTARPTTGGSLSSTSAGRLPSRGNSYSQPLAPTVASASASGRISQPKGQRQYHISNPIPQPEPTIGDATQRPTSQRIPNVRQGHRTSASVDSRGHKRSTTLGNIFGRTNSIFGGAKVTAPGSPQSESPRPEKRYPPTSMKMPLPTSDSPRLSSESRRRPSFSLARKTSGTSVSNKSGEKRRFSLLPAGFTLKGFGSSNKEHQFERAPQRGATAAGHPSDSVESMPYTTSQQLPPRSAPQDAYQTTGYPGERLYATHHHEPVPVNRNRSGSNSYSDRKEANYAYGTSAPADVQLPQPSRIPQSATAPDLNAYGSGRYPSGFDPDEPQGGRASANSTVRPNRVLQKSNRKFDAGFDEGNSGSTNAAKRVMDFFRRRGKARAEGQ